jgi:protein phosphatase
VTPATDPRPRGDISFTSHARSDVGKARKGNEDNFYRGTAVFAVADGMGGHQAGEVASETALVSLQEVDDREWPSAAQAEHALVEAVRAANTDVVEQAAANPDYRGMGTTLTAVLVRDGRLHVAHVGDSRAYLFRPGEGMSQLTTDHTLVEQLVRDGRISRDEIPTHPQRSVITRAIGVETFVEVDTLPPLELEPGDQVLLCSDGLSGPVPDDEIAQILAETADGDEACDALVLAANRAGGPDNITVVLLRIHGRAADGGGGGPAQEVRVPVTPSGAEIGDDTQEFGAPQQVPEVRRISTRSDSGTDFDPDALGRYGAGREERLAPEVEPEPARSLPRMLLGLLGTLVVLGAVAAGAYLVWSGSWYVGVADGQVAIFQGVPEEIAGIRLSRLVQTTDVAVADLTPTARTAVGNGVGEASLTSARNRVAGYRRDVDQRAREEAAERAAPQTVAPAPGATPTPIPSQQPGATPAPAATTAEPPPAA